LLSAVRRRLGNRRRDPLRLTSAAWPASGAAIAFMAGERHLAWANGVIATGANLGKMAGRVAGGVLISAFGAAAVFVLDAITFLVSAVLTRSVRRAFSAPFTGVHADDVPLPPRSR
jgi:MFS family permease